MWAGDWADAAADADDDAAVVAAEAAAAVADDDYDAACLRLDSQGADGVVADGVGAAATEYWLWWDGGVAGVAGAAVAVAEGGGDVAGQTTVATAVVSQDWMH